MIEGKITRRHLPGPFCAAGPQFGPSRLLARPSALWSRSSTFKGSDVSKVRGHPDNYVYIYIYIYICIHINTYVCICICVYIYIYIYINMYMYLYLFVFIFVCIYIYIYIYIYSAPGKRLGRENQPPRGVRSRGAPPRPSGGQISGVAPCVWGGKSAPLTHVRS